MLKKLLCLALCVLLATSAIFPVLATPDEETAELIESILPTALSISSVEDFLVFAENCRLDAYSQNLAVTLTADLDLQNTPFAGVPIFCGTFDGDGHSISGLTIAGEGSVLGLFRYVTAGAVVKNLTVEGTVQPQGSRDCVGSIVGENAGLVENCTFSGTVSASDKVGGIAGVNTVTGVIDTCQTEGQVQGDHFVGGIVGENMGVVRNCINSAPVNITPQQNTVSLSDITIDSLTGSEAANTVTDIGGIAGTSGGVIRNCGNLADIGYQKMGYNIGGIAGSQMGYLVDCRNFGQISGRKEVGGIVGQMEPVTNIVYTTDTLQILQQQLDTMGALAGRASTTAQNSANAITGQIAVMQEHANTAQDAVNMLLPGSGGSLIPDADQIQAAHSALNSSFSGMQNSIQSISNATQDSAAALSQDLRALTAQIGAMGATLDEAGENLGGTITDISDLDTPEDITGKIENSHNYAFVQADMNGGGIAGAIAPENDLDPDEDVDITGQESLNFDSELRAVILGSSNYADISVSKQGAGGITGRMALGLVKDCTNTGTVGDVDAEYVGGITGESMGFIRNCNVKCRVNGSEYVGGIAGTATTLSDCRAAVVLSANEKQGAIAGFAQTRENITGNFYFTLENDPGAIDGISYQGSAHGLDTRDFLTLDALPAMFKTFTVSFVFDDGSVTDVSVVPGQPLWKSQIPTLPEKTGYTATWEGLDSMFITFDTTVYATYNPYTTVIAADIMQYDSRPVVLAEGRFQPEDTLSVHSTEGPTPQKRQTVVDCRQIQLPESPEPISVRYLPPKDSIVDTLMYLDATGTWQSLSYTVDGSYYIFEAPTDSFTLAAIETAPFPWIWYAAAGTVLAIGMIVAILIKKNRRK